MSRSVTVKYSKITGKVDAEAFGFHGEGCHKVLQAIADALGTCTDFVEKAEFYEASLEISGNLDTNLCG